MIVLLDYSEFFFNNFSKSVVLILPYQLPFLQSSLSNESLPKCETHLKIEVRTCTGTGSIHGILKCKWKARRVNVMDSVLRLGWTQYACCAPVQFILPGKKNFRKTAAGIANLEQTFYQTVKRNTFLHGICVTMHQTMHQNWNALSYFCFINV